MEMSTEKMGTLVDNVIGLNSRFNAIGFAFAALVGLSAVSNGAIKMY